MRRVLIIGSLLCALASAASAQDMRMIDMHMHAPRPQDMDLRDLIDAGF
jgi:hypothetical protein